MLPKKRKFLSTLIIKMGFGGSEIGWKGPENIRLRAKKQKLMLVGLCKDKLNSYAHNIKQLKYPGLIRVRE